MIPVSLSMVLLSFLLSLPLCGFVMHWAHKRGKLDTPGSESHKQHTAAIPNLGGVGIFWALILPMLGALVVCHMIPDTAWQGVLKPLAVHMPGLRRQSLVLIGMIGALSCMHVLGLVDDRLHLPAKPKLLIQLLVAGLLVVGCDMRVFQMLDSLGPLGYAGSVFVTVLWLGLITNAMNMLDNMDGLSAGVGSIIAGIYLIATLMGGQWFIAALAALLMGALLGFLWYNFNPARLFMGDGGSLVIGLLLGIISIRTTYFDPQGQFGEGGNAAWYGLLMPAMVMAVPLYDFFSVTTVRFFMGRKIMGGDRNHFSHRLVRRGLSIRGAVLVIWLCTLATGLAGCMLPRLEAWQAMMVAAQSACVLLLLAVLEFSNSQKPVE
jgi:UDP-GlcNAc:undecaprenyl-phosphate GlcNAc-1-phosphate transferase